jgi:hypothetical protein
MEINKSDIKGDILSNWDYLKESNYPEDVLSELAESALPVYHHRILSDWTEMPNEYTDSWKEMAAIREDGFVFMGDKQSIYNLMLMDLFNYYHDTYSEIYSEVRQDKEQEENELEAVK